MFRWFLRHWFLVIVGASRSYLSKVASVLEEASRWRLLQYAAFSARIGSTISARSEPIKESNISVVSDLSHEITMRMIGRLLPPGRRLLFLPPVFIFTHVLGNLPPSSSRPPTASLPMLSFLLQRGIGRILEERDNQQSLVYFSSFITVCAWFDSALFDLDFAKPLHLLPATQVTTYPTDYSEELISSLELDHSTSLYMIELRTSRDFASCLSDLNSAIMICLIDENGRSILQRISAISQDKGEKISEHIHFQRGSIDMAAFKGSKLKQIAALWIGLESGTGLRPTDNNDSIPSALVHEGGGVPRATLFRSRHYPAAVTTLPPLANPERYTPPVAAVCTGFASGEESTFIVGSWRLDGVDVKVINGPTTPSSSSSSMQYKFEASNILLGDRGGFSVVELRPILMTRASSINSSPETLDFDSGLMKEGGMREYAALKFSLLLYDFILVMAGVAVLTVSSNEANAYSFLAGGICGFLYLLLLQRSVDGLSAPSLSDEDSNEKTSLQNYGANGPVVILVSAIFAGIVLCKYRFGGRSVLFSSTEIFTGVAGFLTCKMAVVMAAFKPVPMSNQKNKF
ncbi:hypothetical protein KSP39_PZI019679 [Platanthera zijinensis]|uniref:DUF7755 domain-containing protein n=1 Tax=Platanthera zijinensis TaxID=2320716 RepID=A0AAP0B176_9ASPA